MRTVVIHHGDGCLDGLTAAWLLYHHVAADDFVPAQYGDPPPPGLKGNRVFVVDFSYPREILERIRELARELVVLDHHATARDELADLDYCTFDMERSGARLTWNWLVEHHYVRWQDRSWLVDYVQDGDLWRYVLPHSREILAVVRSYPLDFASWDLLDQMEPEDVGFLREGRAILRAEQQIVAAHVARARDVILDGHHVPAVNATILWSQIANELAAGRSFAACWRAVAGGRKWNLRSHPDGLDVAAIAKRLGDGGGHRHAAGFFEPIEEPFPLGRYREREQGQDVPGEGDGDENRERHRGTLPPKVEEIDAFVRSFFDREGYGPTYRTIARGVELRSTSTVQKHVLALIRAGRLRALPNRRGVVPT